MKITEGQRLLVNHLRKGEFYARATRDFDSDVEDFYPLVLDQEELKGLGDNWKEGESVAARRTMCTITVIKQGESDGQKS